MAAKFYLLCFSSVCFYNLLCFDQWVGEGGGPGFSEGVPPGSTPRRHQESRRRTEDPFQGTGVFWPTQVEEAVSCVTKDK